MKNLCCGQGSVDLRLIELLEQLRAKVGNEITIAAFAEDGKRISRKIKVEETPPCLSVAIDDLLKVLAEAEPT